MFVFATLFGGLKHVDFAMCHVELDGHPVLCLSALHLEHVELQFVMGSRRPSLAEGEGKIADHLAQLFHRSTLHLCWGWRIHDARYS